MISDYMKKNIFCIWALNIFCLLSSSFLMAQTSIIPSKAELNRPFNKQDRLNFKNPSTIYYPETWFHFIGGNVSLSGITADLEAIKAAKISGVQLFHGQFGGIWPGVETQIPCLSPQWDNAIKHTAEECKRLGLRFTMQNCPGWAMSGGPWITPEKAMRNLVWSRIDVDGSQKVRTILPKPQPSNESWRDYKDVAVLAFPTPLDDTIDPLKPSSVTGNKNIDWKNCLSGALKEPLMLSPTTEVNSYWVEIVFPEKTIIRTIELPSINSMNHNWCYEPGISLQLEAFMPDGNVKTILRMNVPQSNWQDQSTFSIACSEVKGVKKYRISICNKHDMSLSYIRLFSGARKNSWESEAGWTLRSIERTGEHPDQSKEAYLKKDQIYDISEAMDTTGNLAWKAPMTCKWTILRIGNVNSGQKNGPAPAEGTGWECNKLSEIGADTQFANYIGRISNGPLHGGLLNGMLMDSWECRTQTWTADMEKEFQKKTGYALRSWLPAVMGYVINDQETTAKFLLDWRSTIGNLFVNKFFGRMAKLAKDNGLTVQYETAAGDVFPADILEYYKYADIPMCEFWQPLMDGFVGSLNFKPIKPTVSAARMYGKPRVAAESFTSFNLTWDEHWEMLKEVANVNYIEGVTHSIFHTYTHNPQTNFLLPGTSFGSNIGTPFLRGETWWKEMPEFTDYLARCSYMLERGKPVSDVLWYIGDEINHKPDQEAAFPIGFKYDYCNPDALLSRLAVKGGLLTTPEGITYKVLWLADNERMLPETLEKIYALIKNGATVIGNAPKNLATLKGGDNAQRRFAETVDHIWGDGNTSGMKRIGKGSILCGMTLDSAIQKLKLKRDVVGGNIMWLHRKISGADWYYVCSPKGSGFKGTVDFHCLGKVELWDPLTGDVAIPLATSRGEYTSVDLDLPHAGCCFIVFTPGTINSNIADKKVSMNKSIELNSSWTISFPAGWGAPKSLKIDSLKAWKDLNIQEEGKAFAGTVVYTTIFNVEKMNPKLHYILDLGRVEMIATVMLNGEKLRTLWTTPYSLDLGGFIKSGKNILKVEVTSSWFNRLVYDASRPEAQRKTWTINGPKPDSPLRDNGLLGPVVLKY